jgi:two-component system, NarL family, response regulator NreC
MTTIVLADDHQIVRHGLKSVLESVADFHVVGEASGGNEAVKLVDKLKPDVLVCDLMMDGTTGFETARLVGGVSPQTNILILSMYSDESYVIEALRSGAKAYVLKTAPVDEMIYAVREVALGNRYLSPSLSEKAYEYYSHKARSTKENNLSVRELEVLQLIVQGYTNERIAELWSVSTRTIESHRTNLMQKLGLHSLKELKYYAFEQGITPHPGVEDKSGGTVEVKKGAKTTRKAADKS